MRIPVRRRVWKTSSERNASVARADTRKKTLHFIVQSSEVYRMHAMGNCCFS